MDGRMSDRMNGWIDGMMTDVETSYDGVTNISAVFEMNVENGTHL